MTGPADPPATAEWDDPVEMLAAGHVTATEFAAELTSAAARSPDFDEGWENQTLDLLTHRGVSWQDLTVVLDAFTSDSPTAPPEPGSIRGSGDWPRDERFRVFLDLDGVVSPIMIRSTDGRWANLAADPLTVPGSPPVTGWDDWTFETRRDVPVPRQLLERMARLAGHPEISVVWLTSWEEGANQLFDDLAMSTRLPVHRLDWSGDTPVTKWSTVVHEHEREPRPFVWIDDHLGVDEYRWARHLLDVDSLVIRTNTFHGITRDCWDHVERWIAEHSA